MNENKRNIGVIGGFRVEGVDSTIVVESWADDGITIPYFHIKSSDGKIDSCIELFNPCYFDMGKHNGKIPNAILKELNYWLGMDYDQSSTMSNWEAIILTTLDEDVHNIDMYDRRRESQPDYNNVNDTPVTQYVY